MKLRKTIISIIVMFIIIGINSQSYAKYVFECTKKAAEITINNNN